MSTFQFSPLPSYIVAEQAFPGPIMIKCPTEDLNKQPTDIFSAKIRINIQGPQGETNVTDEYYSGLTVTNLCYEIDSWTVIPFYHPHRCPRSKFRQGSEGNTVSIVAEIHKVSYSRNPPYIGWNRPEVIGECRSEPITIASSDQPSTGRAVVAYADESSKRAAKELWDKVAPKIREQYNLRRLPLWWTTR